MTKYTSEIINLQETESTPWKPNKGSIMTRHQTSAKHWFPFHTPATVCIFSSTLSFKSGRWVFPQHALSTLPAFINCHFSTSPEERLLLRDWQEELARRLGCVQVNGRSNVLFTVGVWPSSNYRLWLSATRAETSAVHKQWGGSWLFWRAGTCWQVLVHFNDTFKPPYKSSRASTAG